MPHGPLALESADPLPAMPPAVMPPAAMPPPVMPPVALHPFERINPDASPDVIIVCDHASNALPSDCAALGLPPDEFRRHIACDTGAAEITRLLAGMLNRPAVLAGFSRLLIDPNRGEDDPTLVMQISDGAVIPGNRDVSPFQDRDAFNRRLRDWYRPYHDAIRHEISRARTAGLIPALISIHSFTPAWKGRSRPWHVGVLWDHDERLARPLIRALAADDSLTIGDNQPYSGQLAGDCMYRHGTANGYPHALIEIRQDLITTPDQQQSWSRRLADILTPILAAPELRAALSL